MSQGKDKIEFIHRNSNQSATTPGVHYRTFEEVCLDFNGKKLFYTTEMEVADMACCGTTISALATVYGYVNQWKHLRTEQGDYITLTEPIRDKKAQSEISRVIKQKEMVGQVSFR